MSLFRILSEIIFLTIFYILFVDCVIKRTEVFMGLENIFVISMDLN